LARSYEGRRRKSNTGPTEISTTRQARTTLVLKRNQGSPFLVLPPVLSRRSRDTCHHYKREQKELKDKLKDLSLRREPTLVEVYAEKSRQAVYEYLKKTRIATREWLLGMEDGEGEENTPEEQN